MDMKRHADIYYLIFKIFMQYCHIEHYNWKQKKWLIMISEKCLGNKINITKISVRNSMWFSFLQGSHKWFEFVLITTKLLWSTLIGNYGERYKIIFWKQVLVLTIFKRQYSKNSFYSYRKKIYLKLLRLSMAYDWIYWKKSVTFFNEWIFNCRYRLMFQMR